MNLIELSLVCFSGGSTSQFVPPPDVPGDDDPEVIARKKEEADKQRSLARKRKGRRSTILTSGLGLQGSPNTQYGSLYGGKTKLGQ